MPQCGVKEDENSVIETKVHGGGRLVVFSGSIGFSGIGLCERVLYLDAVDCLIIG